MNKHNININKYLNIYLIAFVIILSSTHIRGMIKKTCSHLFFQNESLHSKDLSLFALPKKKHEKKKTLITA